MAVTLPGAASLDDFWTNLAGGVESITRLDRQALLDAGERPERMRREAYVPAAGLLDGHDMFDAEFFGFSPREAAILDPQHRKFLETAWAALENAGHTAEEFAGRVGVYAGCGAGNYLHRNLLTNPDLVEDLGPFQLRNTGNDKDFLATRVSHALDLTGPSINLQTACSTALVGVHQAAKALRDGDCDMALVGGVSIEMPQGRGYLYRENDILSPDGHCRAFDHRAGGTVMGSGAGVVVLRALEDALSDGDHIWAVIRGTGVNNDGGDKAGYFAPSEAGQAEVVGLALDAAGVAPETIGYVECHGTGTLLGDPFEVAGLTQAYRARGAEADQFCGIGSVQTNLGNLDTAAAVAGLVKTALALHHGEIPPSLNFEAPNPMIDFAASPFYVNDRRAAWPTGRGPRRAAVNSLGIGGTNAHAVLEQAPERGASEPGLFPFQPIVLSAKSDRALDEMSATLAAHLRAHPGQRLADVAFTLMQGRKRFAKTRVLVARDHAEAAALLETGPETGPETGGTGRVHTHDRLGAAPDTVFLFPAMSQVDPAALGDLYETEPVFR
ncbi:MAG: polyketide synthase, partial [Maritimibacter sp.]|nr:polyketide synthase [Maritimibacter sp.]